MTDVETNGQDPEKSGYYDVIKNHSSNIVGGFNTIVVKTLKNESRKLSMKKHKREESNLDKRNNISRIIITLFFGLITASLLFYLGLPILNVIINSLRTSTSSYDAEVEFMIDINNDSIEETRYEHILVDTPDMYIEQETYDRKIIPLKKESNLPGDNTSFGNVQVSFLVTDLNFCYKKNKLYYLYLRLLYHIIYI